MEKERDYIQDIAEIRSMMERSSKFMSLSGLAGILAGFYALSGAWIAHSYLGFNPDTIYYPLSGTQENLTQPNGIILLALLVMILAVSTGIYLSYRKARRKNEKGWNAASRRLIINLAVPLAAGGIFIIVLYSKGLTGLTAPSSLLFYGLALFTAGKFTYDEVKILGVVQIALGLAGLIFIEYSLLLWAAGFGIAHIIYGIYMHFRYER